MDIDYSAYFVLDIFTFDESKNKFRVVRSYPLQLDFLSYRSKASSVLEEALKSLKEHIYLHLTQSSTSYCVGHLNFIRDVRGRYIPAMQNLETIVTSEDISRNSTRLEDLDSIGEDVGQYDLEVDEILTIFGYELNFNGLNVTQQEELVKNLTGKSISEIEDIYSWANEDDLMHRHLSDL